MNRGRSFVIPTYYSARLQTAPHIEFRHFRHGAINRIFRNKHVFKLLKTIPGLPVGIRTEAQGQKISWHDNNCLYPCLSKLPRILSKLPRLPYQSYPGYEFDVINIMPS